jgi:hypothetical protein
MRGLSPENLKRKQSFILLRTSVAFRSALVNRRIWLLAD